MNPRINIPGYSALTPKAKQRVHIVAGGLAMMLVVMAVSGMIGSEEIQSLAPPELPKPRPVAVPGGQLDAKDAWMGGAGKDLAKLKDADRQRSDEITNIRGEMAQMREAMRADIRALAERGFGDGKPAQAPAGPTMVFPPLEVVTPKPAAGSAPGPAIPAAQGANAPAPRQGPVAANAPAAFPGQSGPAPRMPPGTVGPYPPGPVPSGPASVQPYMPAAAPAVPTLIKVSSTGDKAAEAPAQGSTTGSTSSPSGAAVGAAGAPGGRVAPPARTLSNFLPVGFTRAVLLGGLAAPTGGQAQGNPVPVLLRMADLAVLPNGWRGQVKGCLVVGEGFGDHSAERAYIRTTLLSCITHEGQVLEVPIKGSVFGEDGMNGMMGKLVTKQGAILGNALLSGIAAGIGSGISQASQITSTTTLGPINTSPTDASGILRQGVGTGVGRALDRLAQYYINLAERTFPVIEVQPGRVVDVVITQGVNVDVTLAAAREPGRPVRGGGPDADRMPLMRVARGETTDEDEE